MTYIYRNRVSDDCMVAEFYSADDAARCFKSMAYDLGDRLIMVTNGSNPSSRIPGCRVNSMGQYVLFPTLGSDIFHRP